MRDATFSSAAAARRAFRPALLLGALLFLGVTAADEGLAVVPAFPSTSPAFTLHEFLADHGLECCIDVITRRPTWLRSGGSIDTYGDLRFLEAAQIDSLPLPPIKLNILRELASEGREQARRQKARQRKKEEQSGWPFVFATCDTLLRGFMLGFGLSFMYETLILNRDFYQATDDLMPRVQRASVRGSVLGTATAMVLVGSAFLVPHGLRYRWLA